MAKTFIHTSIIPSNIREITSLVKDKTNILERNTPSHVRVPNCTKKCLPITVIFSLLLGTTFLGFSIMTVPDGHIGYYTPTIACGKECPIQLYEPGLYFNLPWSRGLFNVVDISNKNITIGFVDGFNNKTCLIEYNVKKPKEYISALTLYSNSNSKLETELILKLKSIIHSQNITNSTTYDLYGLSFNKIYYVTT